MANYGANSAFCKTLTQQFSTGSGIDCPSLMLSNPESSKTSSDRFTLYIIVVSGFFCLVLLAYHFLLDNFAAPGQYTSSLPEWNADRLSMAFFLKYKFKLYHPENQIGPLISDMYGPLLALVYLPAAIANSPTVALIIGKILSIIYYFAPVVWLYISEIWQNRKNLALSLLALIAFFFFTTEVRTLYYDAFRICADCPALTFSALACIVLYRGKDKISLFRLGLSAVLAVSAVWTKQIAIPILFALPLYLFLACDIKTFQRYLVCLVISGITISSALLIAFDPQALFFNLITVPGHQPWIDDTSREFSLVPAIKQLAEYCFLPGIFVGTWIVLTAPHQPTKIRAWIQENPWLLFVIVGLFFIPTSLLGRIKAGGDANGMYTVYFLAMTANLVLLRQASNSSANPDQESLQRISKALLQTMVLMFSMANINLPIPYIQQSLSHFSDNVHQVVYEYSRKHPGQVYFPWHPLSVLMAEGKLYHVDSGPFDRYLAGVPISKEDFMAYLPDHFDMIAIPAWADQRNEYGKFYLHYLPDFTRKIEVPELSGFVVYAQERNGI
jgi:hypothetical protein